jgi:cytochrome c peroxidase
VDADLVVKPFGRKGEFATVRGFDEGAMQFHFGMQPVESVGLDADADGDGVSNEVLIGEMSALEIFITTQDRPFQLVMDSDAVAGFVLFSQVGCSDCHRPSLVTRDRTLEYRFRDEPPHFSVDLSQGLSQFALDQSGGLVVPLYSDLKRHDMGPGLAESFQGGTDQQNSEFITPRLWGVGDSAPYLHDGRALTLDEAISHHGGEAQIARDTYKSLTEDGQRALRTFLKTLRLPQAPNQDVIP